MNRESKALRNLIDDLTSLVPSEEYKNMVKETVSNWYRENFVVYSATHAVTYEFVKATNRDHRDLVEKCIKSRLIDSLNIKLESEEDHDRGFKTYLGQITVLK